MPTQVIDDFRGAYRWLSNFCLNCPCVYEGMEFPTSEHAFVAAKTEDKVIRRYIAGIPTPGQAKRYGGPRGSLTLRPGWDDMRIQVMRDILRSKFAPGSDLADLLVATGDAKLIEGNTWGDTFWGVSRGRGENNLGKLLMELREGLRGGGEG